MTTLIHPNAHPVVYAHTVSFARPIGTITPDNWQDAVRDLAKTRFGMESMRDVIAWQNSKTKAARIAAAADQSHADKVQARAFQAVAVSSKTKKRGSVYKSRFEPKTMQCDNPACSSQFTQTHYRQRYCSTACYDKCRNHGRKRDEHAEPRKISCALCGLPFIATGSTSKLCSDACRVRHKKAAEAARSKVRKAEAKAERKSFRDSAPPIACAVCSAAFSPSHPRIVTCSKSCSAQHRVSKQKAYIRAWREAQKQEATNG